jgi:Rad3-related DNA helicase
VGKSLAYLIPSIVWSRTNDTPVVVSTATRNLQSQLITSDIPKAMTVLGEHAADFKVALLKGRGNYLCIRAVGEFFSAGYWTMTEAEQAEMEHFIEWMRTTADGDLDGYEGLPRPLISRSGDECGGRRCPYYSKCFVYRARRRAARARRQSGGEPRYEKLTPSRARAKELNEHARLSDARAAYIVGAAQHVLEAAAQLPVLLGGVTVYCKLTQVLRGQHYLYLVIANKYYFHLKLLSCTLHYNPNARRVQRTIIGRVGVIFFQAFIAKT